LNVRARVSKGEDGVPSCFETPRSAANRGEAESPIDAARLPQHEGRIEWRVLAKRTQRLIPSAGPRSPCGPTSVASILANMDW